MIHVPVVASPVPISSLALSCGSDSNHRGRGSTVASIPVSRMSRGKRAWKKSVSTGATVRCLDTQLNGQMNPSASYLSIDCGKDEVVKGATYTAASRTSRSDPCLVATMNKPDAARGTMTRISLKIKTHFFENGAYCLAA